MNPESLEESYDRACEWAERLVNADAAADTAAVVATLLDMQAAGDGCALCAVWQVLALNIAGTLADIAEFTPDFSDGDTLRLLTLEVELPDDRRGLGAEQLITRMVAYGVRSKQSSPGERRLVDSAEGLGGLGAEFVAIERDLHELPQRTETPGVAMWVLLGLVRLTARAHDALDRFAGQVLS